MAVLLFEFWVEGIPSNGTKTTASGWN